GTLNSAANALVDSSIALAPLPLGTFNHFAKDLGVPLLLEQALDALAAGRIRSIDVGEINGRVFLNNASLGIYPYAVRRRELARQQLGLRKLPAMGYALLGALWRLPMMNVLLRADDGHQELFKTPFVFIGNNQYRIAALAAVQRETLDRGRLSLFYTRRIGRLQLMRIAASTLLGGARPAPELEMRLTEAVELRFRRRTIKLAMDGEVVRLATPLTVRSRRGALKVVVPVA
ncbi:MAG TPA: diacylglycerol kinase family protein, partial [Candidatus Competibacteraceae bacterium]|nr:diacylglycerol kinase family protein [Candidatus Competibacteraceae bacterium]